MEKKYTHDELIIKAPIDRIWDALINPEKTKLYMFGCEVISDWSMGSEVLWKGAADGVIYVKGSLVALKPNKEFAFTIIDPQASYEDIPENYLTATYTLEETQDGIKLTATQGDYNIVADGQKRFEDTIKGGGWMPVLEAIKKLSEGSLES